MEFPALKRMNEHESRPEDASFTQPRGERGADLEVQEDTVSVDDSAVLHVVLADEEVRLEAGNPLNLLV